jgi:hypothetical protein
MTTAIASRPLISEQIERVLLVGDLSQLTPDERVSYYKAVCESVGLNPLTRPFSYLSLSGKLVLYANKACTDQLRSIHDVSVTSMTNETIEGVYIVTVQVKNSKGRTDMDIGAVPLAGLKGEAFANAVMKSATKAKRRATLSICGLSVLDETEVDSIPGAVKVEAREVESPSPKATSGEASRPSSSATTARPTEVAHYAPPLASGVAPSTTHSQEPSATFTRPSIDREPATLKQVQALNISLERDLKMKKEDREGKLKWISDRVGRPVKSSKDLTTSECSHCIDDAKNGVVS